MRLHFEQVRLASMIEHKAMEAQLRKLSKRLKKVLNRKKKLDDRDQAIRTKVENNVQSIWEPKVLQEKERGEKLLANLRYESAEKINNVEVVVSKRLNDDYGEIIETYNVKLKETQNALEKSQEIFDARTAEVELVQHQLEEFTMKKQVFEEEEENERVREQSTSREQQQELIGMRNKVRELWETHSTPYEHRLKFLESVVNEASESDEYLLKHMELYASKLSNFT
mgnify:CR=1 FL=1|jgi:hypothetical protein